MGQEVALTIINFARTNKKKRKKWGGRGGTLF